jgi:transcription-repair coupling factor (superfamily II helicase)
MLKTEAPANASARLTELSRCLNAHEGFPEVMAALQDGQAATLDGVWGSACALVAAELARIAPGPLLIVCPKADDVDDVCDDLKLFSPHPAVPFPAWESEPGERIVYDETFGDRLRLVKTLASAAAPQLLVASVQSLLQPVPDRKTIAEHTRHLRVGESLDVQQLLTWLVEHDFHNTTAVELPGEFSIRGGIVDLFAPDWFDPVRVELFGDEIESIRQFEVATQRSLESVDTVDLTVLQPGVGDKEHLAAYLPEDAWALLIEPMDMHEEGKHFIERLERPQDVHSVRQVIQQVTKFPSVTASGVADGSLETTCHLQIESVERFSGDVNRVRDELDLISVGHEVLIVCQTDAEIKRLKEIFDGTRLASGGHLHFPTGRLSSGFRITPQQTVLISGAEMFQRTDLGRGPRRRLGKAIDSFLDLREGDLVVHLAHGIGRYRGMSLLDKEGRSEEHLELEFHGGTRIYVPASKIELVQKYVGSTRGRPTLARIGGKTWLRQKQAAEGAVIDLAVDMLQLQASRGSRPGLTFPPDTEWQQEFDASFPYIETPDQVTTISSIKQDMQRSRPMDRLMCGDVGYGKTEVSIRAAFKAVDAGYQVAVLVPTTILAVQHHRTFKARMAEFPFKIESLSRFNTAKEQREIVQRLASGVTDIAIGTHRLASKDVKFENLGLIIIDEEQRFGVEVKEKLKALRHTVDVLTMTATPIPRTLHMSLLGLRDISNLETPPEDRLAVETRVTRFKPEVIRHAVLRELNRGGQIFFVHNRVKDIEIVARRLREIVPEATIEIGHGQMPETKLEKVMLDFVDHKFDILLATTIIESGLDIPNANTIFIDEADRYGLADLHQLRGRVGRYKHRAYCYLLIDPAKHLSPTAVRRLRAIEEFSDMGAGFVIAMRDLEIRGAGNILGTQQSGHIAVVGYELYCQLLENAVRELQQLPPKEKVEVNVDLPSNAYLPRSYVADLRAKIDLYRRLARISTAQELADLADELVDRFGPLPPPVQQLIELGELRVAATAWKIDSIHLEDRYLVFGYNDPTRIKRLKQQCDDRLRIVDHRSAYLPIAKGIKVDSQIVRAAKSVLQGG